MQPRITIPLVEAKQACSAILPHVSTDDVTPVITHALIGDNRIEGTDRVTMGRFELSRKIEGGELLVPRQAVAWVARQNTRSLLNRLLPEVYSVTIEKLEGDKLIRCAVHSEAFGEERVMVFAGGSGNFPPVARLLDSFTPTGDAHPFGLSPKHLEKVTSYAHTWHRDEPVIFELGASDGPRRPAPIRARIGKLSALIQPVLLVSEGR